MNTSHSKDRFIRRSCWCHIAINVVLRFRAQSCAFPKSVTAASWQILDKALPEIAQEYTVERCPMGDFGYEQTWYAFHNRPDRSFATLQECKTAVRNFARDNGFSLSIKRSIQWSGEVQRVWMRCSQGGEPPDYHPKGRNTNKVGCPYELQLSMDKTTRTWTISQLSAKHVGHQRRDSDYNYYAEPGARRIYHTPTVRALVYKLYEDGEAPQDILREINVNGVKMTATDLKCIVTSEKRKHLPHTRKSLLDELNECDDEEEVDVKI
ncbi:hypothetical protein DFS34DRAFT_75944 [Phlyctochytrium arcticum]|nr:hypothetical protein DFS34DRAFT_75944 [Phlyctochytrium arcticum]